MLFWDLRHTRTLNEKQVRARGFDPADLPRMRKCMIFPLTVEQPEHDPETHGLEPDGYPRPSADDPGAFVQKMRVWSIMDRARERRKKDASAKRWEFETRGVTLPDGTRVLTGIDDQNRISTALKGMIDAGIETVDFKADSGWVTLTVEQVQGIANFIAGHVQACFSNERHLHELIDAAETLDDLNSINLDEGWPNFTPHDPANDPERLPWEMPEGEMPETEEPATEENDGEGE